NSDASMRNFDAEFLAELGGTESLELHVDGIQRIVGAWHPQRSVDHLFAMCFAVGAVSRRQVDVLKSAPPADIQTQDEIKVLSLFDPILHHVVESVATLGCQA